MMYFVDGTISYRRKSIKSVVKKRLSAVTILLLFCWSCSGGVTVADASA